MTTLPAVDWALAARAATLGRGPLPDVTRPAAHQYVARLRARARAAGPLAARVMGLRSAGAPEILVLDRDGWVREASRIARAGMAALGRPPRRDGGLGRLLAGGLGAVVGIGLGVASRWMLGQVDGLTGRRRLLLVAPNIHREAARRRFVEEDFHRWVALHEQTHALQFEAAPWLADHLLALVADAGAPGTVDRLVATMTFLEGHADLVADSTGSVPTAARMRRAFGRRPRRGGLLDKEGQYVRGLAFCEEAQRLARGYPFDEAFRSPEQLPTRAEIAEPAAWLRRVHG